MRIVAADNDPAALELVVLDLGFEGHEIVGTAGDGAEAIRMCAEQRPDLLVVDHRMPPGPTGLDVTRTVLTARTAARVVLYSNYQDEKVIRAAERLGARFLAKGDLRALRRAVTGSES